MVYFKIRKTAMEVKLEDSRTRGPEGAAGEGMTGTVRIRARRALKNMTRSIHTLLGLWDPLLLMT